MKEQIARRFRELIEQGGRLFQSIGRDQHGPKYWVPGEALVQYQAWIASAVNLIDVVTTETNRLRTMVREVLASSEMQAGIPTSVFQKVLGILSAAHAEWETGLLGTVEYLVAAATFDDFLDHAAVYHKANKKMEAAVLASAVFEDALRRLARKHNVSTSGQAVEGLIDELQRSGIVTPVKAKRLKACAGLRNRALHAEWDAFDIRDVGEQIAATRELVEQHL
jgi:uncharacterized protein YutE (UPF0331/DUF86 family)